ncbi:MAG: hypothetical protein ACYDD9_14190 [Acidithiobacillus sp.]
MLEVAVTTRLVNEARRTVARRYGIALVDLPSQWWEVFPHDSDPVWKFCVGRAIDEAAWRIDADPSWLRPLMKNLRRAQMRVLDRAHELLREIAEDAHPCRF